MKTIITLLLSVLTCFTSYARDFSDIEITATKAAGKVFMLQGAGGNIGVLATDSGLLLVDDQFSPLANKIEKAMKGISTNELKYIVNTHFHGDHTGGNTHFSK
jgi:glyoxylase-like metal-dependent hydrolase (beta-lactamase superfamily II)